MKAPSFFLKICTDFPCLGINLSAACSQVFLEMDIIPQKQQNSCT